MFKTRVTEKLGIKYPIIQGGMLWTSLADFVAEVSNAGGLGILTAPSFFTKEEFSQEVKKTKSLTDKPFGVNIPFIPGSREMPIDGYIEAVIEEGVKVVETVGAIEAALIERFHSAGVTCIHKTTAVRYAMSAVKRGVDMVTVEGTECAGHIGMDDISSMVLVQRAVEQLEVPVIAAGGFVDGKGLVAALALGAEAVLMGSRFFLTKEGPAHPNVKEWCLNAQETDTMTGLYSLGDPVRFMKTELAQKVLDMEKKGAGLEELLPLISGLNQKQAYETGDMEFGVMSVGQCVGLIHDMPSIKELIDRIMDEAAEALDRLNSLRK